MRPVDVGLRRRRRRRGAGPGRRAARRRRARRTSSVARSSGPCGCRRRRAWPRSRRRRRRRPARGRSPRPSTRGSTRWPDGPVDDVIVACWVRLEDAAAAAGSGRRPSETSAELAVRVLDQLPRAAGRRRTAARAVPGRPLLPAPARRGRPGGGHGRARRHPPGHRDACRHDDARPLDGSGGRPQPGPVAGRRRRHRPRRRHRRVAAAGRVRPGVGRRRRRGHGGAAPARGDDGRSDVAVGRSRPSPSPPASTTGSARWRRCCGAASRTRRSTSAGCVRCSRTSPPTASGATTASTWRRSPTRPGACSATRRGRW